jgi:hypothetical protein
MLLREARSNPLTRAASQACSAMQSKLFFGVLCIANKLYCTGTDGTPRYGVVRPGTLLDIYLIRKPHYQFLILKIALQTASLLK